MAIRQWIDQDARRVRLEITGTFTIDQIIETIEAVVRDPAFRPGFAFLSDHRGVVTPITPEQARLMIGHMERFSTSLGGTRWAVVTTAPASHGMMRMVAVLAERVPLLVQVFQTMEEAERWLAESDA